MNYLPKSRQSDIVVQELGKELLIYDLKTNRAYTLNETSMIVFNACDERTSFNDLKRISKDGFVVKANSTLVADFQQLFFYQVL